MLISSVHNSDSDIHTHIYSLTLCDPMDCSPPVSSILGIFQAGYWGELPFPTSGDLLYPGIELAPPALAGGFFTTESPGKLYFRFFSVIGYYKILSIVPCAMH